MSPRHHQATKCPNPTLLRFSSNMLRCRCRVQRQKIAKNGCGSKVCDMFPHFFWLRLYLEHEKEPSPIGNSSVEFTMLVQIFLAGLANKHTLWDKKQNLVCWLEAAQILAKRRYLCDPLPCHSAQIHAHLQRD